jgi:hypothetical protein
VSIDYLVKDEIEELDVIRKDVDPGVKRITLEEALHYVEGKFEASKLIAKGVLFCI